jgi:peptidoglycan lytic transglycosylase
MLAAATGRVRRRAVVWAAALAVCVLGALARPAAAGTGRQARLLGEAYRAYDAGDLPAARKALARLHDDALVNRDYALWLRGQVALLSGDGAGALRAFRALAKVRGSRFAGDAPWRIADAEWLLGRRADAARDYGRLVGRRGAGDHGDVGVARFRIAITKTGAAERAALHAFRIDFPRHPLEPQAEARLRQLGGDDALALTAAEHIERAQHLSAAHLWDEAVAELELVSDREPTATRRDRDYWLGETLYKRRRRYLDAGHLLLAVYPDMGARSAEAMFHGARALSRADHDSEAITWYHKVVARYPHTAWAQEAAFLAGWLDFNRGKYADGIPPLEDALRRYPSSKWADSAVWFLGMSHYLLGHYDLARDRFARLARGHRKLWAGKGAYWAARCDQRLGDAKAAEAGYKGVLGRFPFSWYAILARARLHEMHVDVGPFGGSPPPAQGPAVASTIDRKLVEDPMFVKADELLAAGLGVEAGEEMERGERAFLKHHDRAAAFAVLFDRYRAAGNFYRPWMIATVYGASALDGPPTGPAKIWWQNAYPRAYRPLVDKYKDLGGNPEGYLYSIMRKESGFNPNEVSYADARGLLQMIPPTTQHVCKVLALEYAPGLLYDPEFNVRTGAWYIGHLLHKFKVQIPIGAGSFNSGPRPVMKWLDENGDRPLDEFVELVPYTQTREYMKKVTENYARYVYLYQGTVYDQPLTVDRDYVKDALTY